MAHQSLYRAYRPHTFTDVAGQGAIVSALTAQIKEDKVGHAYLFSGSRGLGKTSIARIFARALETDERDIFELDAASNNSVDEIRALNESVHTLPYRSKRKVYILDEAHMLSKAAWNAFLKTLEEPPAHVVLILATTELDKVPDTVRSRCQHFEFKKPDQKALAHLVTDVAKKEGYTIEPDAADLVALLADGSYRDALSVLERVLAHAEGKTLTRASAEAATGAPQQTLVHSFVEALSTKDRAQALSVLRTADTASVDMTLFLTLVISYVRRVLLLRHAPDLRNAVYAELGDAKEQADVLANDKSSRLSHETLLALLDALSRVRFSPVPALPLEIAVLQCTES